MCAFNVIMSVVFQLVVMLRTTSPRANERRGDTIPHVIAVLIPSSVSHPLLSLLVDRRFVILLATLAVSFPLSLHRDIVKLSKSSGFGEL